MHTVMNDEGSKEFSVILISEPHVWQYHEGPAVLTPTTHRNWTKLEPTMHNNESTWAYRSMISTRADLEVEQDQINSSNITAVAIRLPQR